MSIFENQVIATNEEISRISPVDLKGFGEKYDELWYFIIFADIEDVRIVVSLASDKNYKKAMKRAMKNAIERVSKNES